MYIWYWTVPSHSSYFVRSREGFLRLMEFIDTGDSKTASESCWMVPGTVDPLEG